MAAAFATLHHPSSPNSPMTRSTGTVKWFSQEKGFGFVTREDGTDVFVHHSGISGRGFKTLEQGERVEFDVIEEPKGLKASNLVRLDAPAVGDDGRAGDPYGGGREDWNRGGYGGRDDGYGNRGGGYGGGRDDWNRGGDRQQYGRARDW
jgi:cold shock protein